MEMACDYLVIGSGLAGQLFALKVADHGRVLILTKDILRESNSRYAQGGVAAVWDDKDRFEDHIQDTLVAGAGLCRRQAVDHVVRSGPERIQELIELGVIFDRREDKPEEHELHQPPRARTRRSRVDRARRSHCAPLSIVNPYKSEISSIHSCNLF